MLFFQPSTNNDDIAALNKIMAKRWTEHAQKKKTNVLIHMKLSITGPVPLATCLVQGFQQLRYVFKVFEALYV